MTTNETMNFHNDHINVKATRGPKCHVSLVIEIAPLASEAAYQKAVKEVSKEVSIPGFRKGKAPAALISDSFGKTIDKEFHDIAIETAIREAMNLTKIYPFEKNKFEGFKLHSLTRDKGGSLTISYHSFPEIPEIHLKDIPHFEFPVEAVDEKKINGVIEQLRHYHAAWNPVTDRAAHDGDYVTLTINTVGQPSREVCSEKTFKLVEGEMAEWMRKAVTGMKPGDVTEATSEKAPSECSTSCNNPEHHHDHDHSHDDHIAPILCSIKLDAINLPTLPEIDEEFAKRMGCATLEEFHEKAKEYAESTVRAHHRGKLRNAMYEHLRQHYPFEVPAALITKDVEEYVKSCIDELSPEEKTDAAVATIEREAKVLEDELTKRVYTEYLTGTLASKFNLKVTQQEISQEVMRELIQNRAFEDKENFEKTSEMVSQRIARDKLIEKALDYLIDNAGKEKA